jgi:DNA-binding MarR family transcriptional regulator
MSISLQKLGRSVKRLQNLHHRALDARLVQIGATLAQWDALRAIDRNPGASSHDLADFTFQTDQSFGALATKLVKKGLVTRTPGRGRMLRHSLTAKGRSMLAEATGIAEKTLAESFAPLSETERAQLLSLIERLLPKAG